MTGIVFWVVQKGFDKVWHVTLINKLISDDVPTQLIKIYVDYLKFCSFTFRVWNSLSDPQLIFSTPQGALSSPALYNVYVIDIPRKPGIKLAKFVAVTAVIILGNNPHTVIEKLHNLREQIFLLVEEMAYQSESLEECRYRIHLKKFLPWY